MKVICVKCANTEYYKLTINKIYECFFINEYGCQIINDRGIIQMYPRHLFVTLEEHRDIKIKELGI